MACLSCVPAKRDRWAKERNRDPRRVQSSMKHATSLDIRLRDGCDASIVAANAFSFET